MAAIMFSLLPMKFNQIAGFPPDRVLLIATIAMTAALVSPRMDAQRLLKPEDFAQLRDVDEPNISPDGNLIAYVVKTADMEKDKLPGNLWLAKWDGSENRALTFGNKGAAHPRWSPDGKWIAFLSGREDENEIDQLWVLSIGGGEAEKLTDLEGWRRRLRMGARFEADRARGA